MPRSRNLKGIAAGLESSFVSRNNDISGYWGIGVLCRDALTSGGTVKLDLIQRSASPATPSSAFATSSYTRLLETMLGNAGFSGADLAAASITLQFGTSGNLPSPLGMPGEPFLCTVALTDRKGHKYSVSSAGRCLPHDPAREHRSVRASGF